MSAAGVAAPYTEASPDPLLSGALDVRTGGDGWARPSRFAPEQTVALGSCRAWHPGLFRQMAACTSGICLDFLTDAAHLRLRLFADPMPSGSRAVIEDVLRGGHAPEPPFDGFALEVDGEGRGFLEPDAEGLSRVALGARPGTERHVRVWLPCLAPARVGPIAHDGGYLKPAAAQRHLLVLGDSIAQGFVACDPSQGWPALLAKRGGLQLVNQGVGGQVFQPGSLVGLRPLVDPALIVVEFGANYRYEPCQASRVEREVRTYLFEVATAWPDVPAFVLTPTFHTEDLWPTHARSCFSDVARIIREQAAKHPGLTVVEGEELLPPDPTLLADGSDHPGPAGQRAYYEGLSEHILRTLAKRAG